LFTIGPLSKENSVQIVIQNETIDLDTVRQLYPAAMIRYADGTVTPISLEWYDNMATEEVELLHYAICVHYKEKEKAPAIFPYETRESLEEGIGELAQQLDPSME
jgi:putative cell wall-binding protein